MKNMKNKFEDIFEAVAFTDVGEFNSAKQAVAGHSKRPVALLKIKRRRHLCHPLKNI